MESRDEKLTELQTEVQKRFGVLPNFFRLCPERPEITKNLWGFAGFAYLDNPLPSLFKERLFVFLSRFCDVRYCIVRHLGFLTELGWPSGDHHCSVQSVEEVIRLLRRSFSRGEQLEKCVSLCAACETPLAQMPGSDSELEDAIFDCAGHVFLQTPDASRCQEALRRPLGESHFHYLTVFLAFIRTAHYWTRIHPELVFEDDINHLLATHERLAEYLLNDPEASACEISRNLLSELAELRTNQHKQAELLHFESEARKTAEKARHESETRFRMLADNIAPLVWTCDALGHVTWCNRRWLDYSGMNFEDMRGAAWQTSLHPGHAGRVIAGMQRSARTGESWEDTFPLRGRDGYRWFISRAVPIRDRHGNVLCWFGTCTDIEDLKQAQNALAEALEKSESATRAKDHFLAMLSHELRTPLNPVLLTASDAVMNPQIPPEVRDQFEIILKNVEAEVQLIDDLLDISRVTHGKLNLNLRTVDAHAVLLEAIDVVLPEAGKKLIQIAPKLGATQVLVSADSVRLKQIFWNLLRNAVKFTPEQGMITVETVSTAGEFKVKVSDNGIGLTPDELNRLFSAFSQGDHSREEARVYGGLGLGLAISKKLVELHSGCIQAASAGRGHGAAFSVEFPLAVPKDSAESQISVGSTGTVLKFHDLSSGAEPTRVAV